MNSKQPVQTINQWLSVSTEKLSLAKIPSARLDAELLLCYMLGVDRTWLIAHGDDSLHATALKFKGSNRRGSLLEHGEDLLLKRLKRVPIAYITGKKEFYGRDFIVTSDTLVPRPETEALIELAKKHSISGAILDVGTGSGCIGLTLALETDCKLTVSDTSEAAIEIARKNAKQLGVKPVRYIQSDLLSYWLDQANTKQFDTIVSNLPYVDRTWDRSPETEHEPAGALFAADGGLALIKKLIDEAPQLMPAGGYLLLEADPEQHADIIRHSSSTFEEVDRLDYALLLRKR